MRTGPPKLPPLLAAAIPGIRWSLEIESAPLCFQSLEELSKIPQRRELASPALQPIVGNYLPERLHQWLTPLDTAEARQYGMLSVALILLGHDFVDECHNLVTPLSWPEDVHFANGPSSYAQASPAVQACASYIHSLVHRKEAFHCGEFGIPGFHNANYWSNAAVSAANRASPLESPALPVAGWLDGLSSLTRRLHGMTPTVQHWSSQLSKKEWDSKIVHHLCATVLKQTNPRDHDLQRFAEQLVETEIRVLLSHTLSKAGFVVDSALLGKTTTEQQLASILEPRPSSLSSQLPRFQALTSQLPPLDMDVALSAARKVSSAHQDLFHSQGSVVLRRVFSPTDPRTTATFEEQSLSIAAGIACRLLNAPACQCVQLPLRIHHVTAQQPASPKDIHCKEQHGEPIITIEMVTMLNTECPLVAGGGALFPGDIVAYRENLSDISNNRVSIARNLCTTTGSVGSIRNNDEDGSRIRTLDMAKVMHFRAVADKMGESATYRDPLFGSRGATPTTVIQWSKGTIF